MPDGGGAPQKTIGKCRLISRLGHGKTARIFRAFYEPLQKEVAVKVMKADAHASGELRDKFLNEARALARLDHVNIVKVFDVVEEAGYLLIIMELLKGMDLYRAVRQNGPFETERAVSIIRSTAQALKAAHDRQIIHRDVKPQNIMLSGRRDKVKLVDFGLATEGAVIGKAGTPHFMSPEQILGRKVDEKSDIYSLGASFHFILTGEPPYPGETRKEILDKHLEGNLPAPSRVNRELAIPRSIDPVVKRMMAPIAGYRFNANDLCAALDGLNLQRSGRARGGKVTRAAARREKTRKGAPVGPILAGLGLLVAVAVVLFLLLSGDDKPPVRKADKPVTPEVAQPGPTQPTGDQAAAMRERAATREQRQREADRLLAEAEAFARNNPDDFDAVYAKYKKLWDDFSDTGGGQRARELFLKMDEKKAAAANADKEAEAQRARKAAREVMNDELAPLLEGYKFGIVQQKLESFMLTHGESPADLFLYNLMFPASECLRVLGEVLAANPRKSNIRGISILGGDANGVTLKDDSGEKKQPWSYFSPEEVERLGNRNFGFRDSDKSFLLYAFCEATGLKDAAENWKQTALARDEFGKIERMLDQLKSGR